jgi:hypothetical protein
VATGATRQYVRHRDEPSIAVSLDGTSSVQHRRIEERSERFGVGALHVTLLIDHEMGEERLVEQAAELWGCCSVGCVTVPSQIQRPGEVRLDRGGFRSGSTQPLLDRRQLAGDAFLLPCDEVHRHGTAVDRFDQLLTVRGELRFLGREQSMRVGCVLAAAGQLRPQTIFQCIAQLRPKPNRRPVLLNQCLDLRDEHCLAGAVGGLLVSPQADEVRVDRAVPVLGVRDDQPAAATAAEDAGLQVVRVVALPFADQVGGKNVLHLLPGDRVSERLVVARVGDATVDDFAPVVGISQDVVQDIRLYRPTGQLRCPPGGESPKLQFVDHRAQRPLPGGIRGVCPGDVFSAIRVGLDCPFLAALWREASDVAVAERRLVGSAARQGLLRHTLMYFGGQVAGVELRDGRHDAVQQHPGRRLIDVLSRRDQRRSGLPDGHGDLDVIDAIPSESVNFVDDDIVDVVFSQVLQHPLQVRAVG